MRVTSCSKNISGNQMGQHVMGLWEMEMNLKQQLNIDRNAQLLNQVLDGSKSCLRGYSNARGWLFSQDWHHIHTKR